MPSPAGNHIRALAALSDPSAPDAFKLRPPYVSQGPGDDNILEGLRTLAELRESGKVRKIGIAGYPLPTLLRLALLARENGLTLDIVQTYAQETIVNPGLTSGYLAAFEEAGVREVTNAAPLAMGILTTSGGPEWHPARDEKDGVFEATREAAKIAEERGTTLENVALDYGFREIKMKDGRTVPVVIGCKSIYEIRRTVKGWRQVNVPGERSEDAAVKARQTEEEISALFDKRGVKGLSWASPTPTQRGV
jgi:aryl-alcohol dehydrogenase-like predicted oxidoreductase